MHAPIKLWRAIRTPHDLSVNLHPAHVGRIEERPELRIALAERRPIDDSTLDSHTRRGRDCGGVSLEVPSQLRYMSCRGDWFIKQARARSAYGAQVTVPSCRTGTIRTTLSGRPCVTGRRSTSSSS